MLLVVDEGGVVGGRSYRRLWQAGANTHLARGDRRGVRGGTGRRSYCRLWQAGAVEDLPQ